MRRRRHFHLFEPMTEFKTLVKAYKSASQGKRDRLAVLSFGNSLEASVFQIQSDLRNETYSFGPYRSFYVHEPKTRLIESACFRDRVVHHAIYDRIEMIFDKQFYDYSFACRAGRGTHAAMLTLHKWMKASKRPVFLKCDIRKFFPSVNRTKLFSVIEKTIGDTKLLKLLDNLIHTAPQSGIPIGNLTSQLFANIYMNELDQFVKRQLREKYYIRYMDDFIFLLNDRQEAHELRSKVEDYVSDQMLLEMSPEKVRIGHVAEGIPFVGYCLRPQSIKVRGAPFRRISKKVRKAYRKSFGPKYLMEDGFWDKKETKRTLFYASWSSFVGQTKYVDNGNWLQEDFKRKLEILPP